LAFNQIYCFFMGKKAIVLLSGGLDSATVLAIARQQGYACYGLSCDYGQRHHSELDAAKSLAKTQCHAHRIIRCDIGQLGHSALTDEQINVPEYQENAPMPVTYVPARNTWLLSMALGWAEVIAAEAIFAGMSAVDYSGYPDCRPAFIDAFQKLINVATHLTADQGKTIALKTPLLHLNKAQTIGLGHQLGVDYGSTVSCYNADASGRACGSCDSCVLRRRGFVEAGMTDPTRYQSV
jgi:7-cyano-7-deazaguanine synthase